MEGTWGTRVWGKIQKGRTETRFYLAFDVREDIVVTQDFLVSNDDLEYNQSALYARTLNNMVLAMQAEVDSYTIVTDDVVTTDPTPVQVIPEPEVEPMVTRTIEQPEPYVLPTDPQVDPDIVGPTSFLSN